MEDTNKGLNQIRGGYQTQLPQSEKTTSFWSRSAQHAKRVRTDQERLRRHLYGDKGAKFSSRKLVPGTNGIMGALTTVIEKDNLIVDMATQEKKKCPGVYGFYEMEPDEKALANKPKGRGWRYVMAEKGPAWVRIRKLTPRECFRLMNVDEDKIDRLLNAGISDSQLYKLAGNSIVVSCMEGIFYNAFCEEEKEQAFGQLSLF